MTSYSHQWMVTIFCSDSARASLISQHALVAQRGSSSLLRDVASKLPVARRLSNIHKVSICARVMAHERLVSHECQDKIKPHKRHRRA